MFVGVEVVRAGVYVRISEDRTGDAAGVGRQETDCRALCDRLGWDVADVYVDNDVSAYRARVRPAYERLLGDLKDGLLDAVVVWHPDRLTRRPVELERFIEILDVAGARAATVVAGDYDLATASGRLVARILGATARAESERMGERIRRAHDDRAASGLPHAGGVRPFGFEPDRTTVVPSEAGEVRRMAELLLAGTPQRQLAADLNARSVATTAGGAWTGKSVRQLLLAPRVAGLRQHRGEIVGEGSWPALLDVGTWEAVRTVLTDPTRTTPRRPRRYLLTGLLRCWQCGGRLIARGVDQAGSHSERYHCRSAKDGGCGGVAVAVPGIDGHVRRVVLAAWPRLAVIEPDVPEVPTAPLEARQVELAEMWAAGEIGRGEYLAARQEIERRLAGARRSTPAAVAVERAVGGSPVERWEALSMLQRRAVIDSVIERIVVGPVVVRGWNRYDARRITQPPGEVVWRS